MCMYVSMRVSVSMYVCVCMYVCVPEWVYACECVYACVCVCVYVCVSGAETGLVLLVPGTTNNSVNVIQNGLKIIH